ncbi:MAG: helix-turn-helix domain-containing protein [Deltaproteobacteria bacterium]|jgi:hypothetical protein|nr:helix-turn-helix domain-containing protein [Deltaproteobacteria bacterium]
MEKDHITGLKDLCAYLNMGENTLRKFLKLPGFPAVRITGRWYSSREALNLWFKEAVNRKPPGRPGNPPEEALTG